MAWCDTESLTCIVPFTCTGSKPLEVPGSSETSPLIMVAAPVLVIAEVAMIPNVEADPRCDTGGGGGGITADTVKFQV